MENLNNKQNTEQKQAWVTPELFDEKVQGTEGKAIYVSEYTNEYGSFAPS